MEIIYNRKGNGWIAYVKGKRKVWEFGHTMAEAVGMLMVTLSAYHNSQISIRYAKGKYSQVG